VCVAPRNRREALTAVVGAFCGHQPAPGDRNMLPKDRGSIHHRRGNMLPRDLEGEHSQEERNKQKAT